MSDSDKLWALVLAAGDGRRLRALTTTGSGLAIPKQFCSLERGPSLLREASAAGSLAQLPGRRSRGSTRRCPTSLQGQEQHLRVLPVPDCGWSDLGTPERVAEALSALPRIPRETARTVPGGVAVLSLAAQSAAMRRVPVAAAGGG